MLRHFRKDKCRLYRSKVELQVAVKKELIGEQLFSLYLS